VGIEPTDAPVCHHPFTFDGLSVSTQAGKATTVSLGSGKPKGEYLRHGHLSQMNARSVTVCLFGRKKRKACSPQAILSLKIAGQKSLRADLSGG